MLSKRWVVILLASAFGSFMIIGILMVIWGTHLSHTIKERMAGQRWASPTEFYSAPERFLKGQSHVTATLTGTLERLEYSEVIADRPLRAGEFSKWDSEKCRLKVTAGVAAEVAACWVMRPRIRPDSPANSPERLLQVVAVNGQDTIEEVYEGDPPQATPVIELEPEIFAQFYGGQPVLRRIVNLGDVPPSLLNSIVAIEDRNFLTHHGVSWTGMLRAAIRDVMKGRLAEGGSTLTQQLIKNYFLTSKKHFSRKITEILMALILESQFSKDEILETYINEVYLGQQGPFEIHGVGVAARSYFNKAPKDLTVAEGALLAGMIQSPARYNPFVHMQKAEARRAAVLKAMSEVGVLTAGELEVALKEPLPTPKNQLLHDQAPFFIDSVKFQLHKLNLPEPDGMQVFTTLNLRAQRAATEAVLNGLNDLEKNYANIKKIETKYNSKLEAALISADPTNGFVQAVVGGRAYNETQLNRAIQSRRQVGSIFKPFVYLAAFSSNDINGVPYTPITQVLDEQFTVTYDKQSWTPQNFDDRYEGEVPVYHALEESLNAATAKVELQVGVQKVADVATRVGIDSPLVALPSLALGAAALTPFEVLQAYCTLDHRGELNPLTFIYRVVGPGHSVLYEFKPVHAQVADPVEARETVSLMEQVLVGGTGKSIPAGGFTHPAAGKTGTTNDKKDAWFGGFTPLHAAVVWVGFDQPQPTGLSGGLGAIPIWLSYMKAYAATYPPVDFATPEGAVKVTIDPESNMVATPKCPRQINLVFKKGQEPTAPCWLPHNGGGSP